jgi:hypothetical protein
MGSALTFACAGPLQEILLACMALPNRFFRGVTHLPCPDLCLCRPLLGKAFSLYGFALPVLGGVTHVPCPDLCLSRPLAGNAFSLYGFA